MSYFSELIAEMDTLKAKQEKILSSIKVLNKQQPSKKRKSQNPVDDFNGKKRRVDIAVVKDAFYEEVCVICENRKSTMLYPCSHISVCDICMNDVSFTNKCPLCKDKGGNISKIN